MQTEKVQFSNRLRQLFLHHNVTQRTVAERTNCTGATMGRWLRGDVPFSISVLAALHREFNVDLNELICGPTEQERAKNDSNS
jgi:transcriptional regulator with XRE-family HTH domain